VRNIHYKITSLLFVFFLNIAINAFAQVPLVTQTFTSTGDFQSFTVPCVSSITVTAWGAGGAGSGNDVQPGNVGGGGAYATSVITVTPGQVLTVYVGSGGGAGVNGAVRSGGGAGGFGLGNGGTGGNTGPTGSSGGGGGGGGGTGIMNGGTILLVAGGGGGAGGGGENQGGATGGGGGQNGGSGNSTGGLTGASTTTAGLNGPTPPVDNGGAGGGGGGLLGGGGGTNSAAQDYGSSGGAGGTSKGTTITLGNGQTPGNSTDPDLCASCALGGNQGVAGGNGFLEISYTPLAATVATTTMACVNATATVTPSGGSTPYTYNWEPNGGTTATVDNLLSGTYTITVTDANNCTASKTFTIIEAALTSISITSPINPYCDTNKLDWVTWSNVTSTTGVGVVSSSLSLSLTKTTGGLGLTPTMYGGPTFPAQYNIPISNQALENTQAGVFTFCFSKPVVDPQVAFSSIGNPSLSVPITTSVPYITIWNGPGMSAPPNNTTLIGTEGYTIIEFPGQHSCLSFNYEVSENYCNLAFGIRDTNCQTTPICKGSPATFTASGAVTYTWSPATGLSQSTGSIVSANPSTYQTYTIIGTDAKGCKDTAITSVKVNSLPVPTVSSFTNVSCFGGDNGAILLNTITGGLSPYAYSWTNGGTAIKDSILIKGSYSVTVTDANGCKGNTSQLISQPTILKDSITGFMDVSCFGLSNGSVTVGISGGTMPYTYSWSPSGGTTAIANNLAAGGYTLTIVDANFCSVTQTITVTQPPVLTLTVTQTNILCSGLSTGSATATAVGGTGPYVIGVNSTPQQSGVTFTGIETASGLPAGSYTFGVQDENSCQAIFPIIITQPSPLSYTITQTNITCNGLNNGSTTVTTSGGTSPYTYTWSPGGSHATIVNNLAPETYTVALEDANFCSLSETVSITQPSALTLTAASTNITCNGLSNGSATATVGGGTTPYTYSWSPSGGADVTASNLPPGTYTVKVLDANLCTSSATVSVTQPAVLTLTATSTNISCNGLINGSATATATGGTATYTIGISSNPPQGGITTTGIETVSGLPVGSYTLGVQDVNGCQAIFPITITQPIVLKDSIYIATNVSCNGGSNGTANASAWGGTGPYSYSWNSNPAQATANASNLPIGTYMVSVKDANACTTSSSVTITQPPPVTAVTTQTNVTCNGLNNGIANVNVSGGSGVFDYTWNTNPVQVTPTATGLAPGTYTAIISNSDCSPSGTELVTNGDFNLGNTGFTSSYTYTPPPNTTEGQYWVSTANQVSTWNGGMTSNGDHTTGVGNLMIINGVGTANSNVWCQTISVSPNTNYIFSTWVSSFDASSPALLQFSINGDTIGKIFSAPPSTNVWSQFYSSFNSGTNTNANICIVNQNTSAIGNDFGLDDISFQPCAPSCSITAVVTITQPAVLKDSINSINVTCNGLSNGSATVTTTGGTTPYSYFWTHGSTTTMSTHLPAGIDTVKITDANNCKDSTTVTITQPTAVKDSIVISTNVSCFGGNNGSATAGVSGGTIPYTYLWSNGNTSLKDTVLIKGIYTFTVTDSHHCTDTTAITITQPAAAIKDSIISSLTRNDSCFNDLNGSATVGVTGGTRPYSYLWMPNGATDSLNTGLKAGTYTVKITDAKGCKDSTSIKITQPVILKDTCIGTTICIGQSAILKASQSGGTAPYTYFWNGTASATNDTSVNPPQTTPYSIVVKDIKGCIASNTVTVDVKSKLSVMTISPDTAGCIGETAHLNATGSGGDNKFTYLWNPGSLLGQFVTVHPTITTIYTLTLTDACGTPAATDTVKVTVNPLPVVSFAANPPKGCYPLPVTFTINPDTVTVSSFVWNFGNGHTNTSSTYTPQTQNYTKAGNYKVTLIAQSDKGCTSKDSLIEIIYSHPKAVFNTSPDDVTIINPTVQFLDASTTAPGSSISSVLWQNFGDASDSISSMPNPMHAYRDTGTYQVTLIVTNTFGCKDTTIQPVVINPYFTLYIPNAFTPNGDSFNGTFNAVGNYIASYDMKIYDRWGALIFESNAITQGWNGSKGNVIAEEGVYVYIINVVDTYTNSHTYKGTVTLIK
jgi:gliding motility-associated-like protein